MNFAYNKIDSATYRNLFDLGWRVRESVLPSKGEDCTLARVDLFEDGTVEQFLTCTGSFNGSTFDLHDFTDITHPNLPVSEVDMWRTNEVPRSNWKVEVTERMIKRVVGVEVPA